MAEIEQPRQELSPWWRYGILLIVLGGFAVLAWLSVGAYLYAPPIPDRVVDESGATVFTGKDIIDGQQVFNKYALMDNGTMWGHGAYLGPDFSATYLHQLVVDSLDTLAQKSFQKPFQDLTEVEQAAVKGRLHDLLTTNRFNSQMKTLVFTPAEAASFREQQDRWRDFFGTRAARGLPEKFITNPEELRQLTSFFAWGAWAAAATIPGKSYSYTNNFPYEPALDNGPSSDAVIWSALSLITLLAGTATVLLAFGRFDYLGWHGTPHDIHPQLLPGGANASQRATVKYFVVVALLFLMQVLVGGAIAHYRVEPQGFYGFNLDKWLPSTILRSWHLQTAIFWIATAYVAGGLFLSTALGRREPRGQVLGTNILFVALLTVVVGSLLGEWAGVKQLLGNLWFWFGNQGWEYLEIGRAWQIGLAAGLVFWVFLLVRAVRPALKDPEDRQLSWLFLIAAASIPVFYLPAFFFDSRSHFTVVDTWRFWIIHLWVEGFFELFVTVMVAVLFYKLNMVSRQTATRVIYLDAVLFLGAGIIGTGHHWYWTGQSNVSMALAATFSAMEVVPLILLTLDASAFMRLMRNKCDICNQPVSLPHKWTFYFLIAVGVWNFVGAGIFGFLINLPVVSYYEVGTNLTNNHSHAALMGVFGMLAVALLVFVLRQVSDEAHWQRVEKYIKVSFWGLNIGLALMVILNLFPSGVLQFFDAVEHGYWHARSPAFSDRPIIMALEWARLPADALFILLGVLPLALVTVFTYWKMILRRQPAA
jgi:nitric oxide reductase subunit B